MNETCNVEPWLILGAVGVVWVISAITATGWLFAHIQGSAPNVADELGRENLGMSVLFGMLCGILGPFGVLMAWLVTGFAEHGWRLRSKPSQRQ
jgi:hypothetical protein